MKFLSDSFESCMLCSLAFWLWVLFYRIPRWAWFFLLVGDWFLCVKTMPEESIILRLLNLTREYVSWHWGFCTNFFLEHSMFFRSRESEISELGGVISFNIFFYPICSIFYLRHMNFPFAVIIFELHNYYLLTFKSLSFPFTPTDSFKPFFYAIISGFVLFFLLLIYLSLG